MLEVNAEERLQLKKSGQTFLGILNDIKRRPEDAALELGVQQMKSILLSMVKN